MLKGDTWSNRLCHVKTGNTEAGSIMVSVDALVCVELLTFSLSNSTLVRGTCEYTIVLSLFSSS